MTLALARAVVSSCCHALLGLGRVTLAGAAPYDVAVVVRRSPFPFIITNSKLPSPIPHVSEKQRKLARRSILVGSSSGLSAANFGFCSPPATSATTASGLGVSPNPRGKDSIGHVSGLVLIPSSWCLCQVGPSFRHGCGDTSVPHSERHRAARAHVARPPQHSPGSTVTATRSTVSF